MGLVAFFSSFFPMPDTPASNALVTTKKECPLCLSPNREYIDATIMELRQHDDSVLDENGAPVESEPVSYTEIEASIRELLEKFSDTTEFNLTDLIVHAGQHTLVSQLAGLKVRSEGNYLIVGNQMYQRIDPKDALSFGIATGVQMLADGRMKLTANAWTNMMALLWRMTGSIGTDEFIRAMIEKTQSGGIDESSPLGKAYADRQRIISVGQNTPNPQNNSGDKPKNDTNETIE